MDGSPDKTNSRIRSTRASLDRRLNQVAARLHDMDPRVRLGPEPLKRVAAMAVVATGVVLLIRNLKVLRQRQQVRRLRRTPIPVL